MHNCIKRSFILKTPHGRVRRVLPRLGQNPNRFLIKLRAIISGIPTVQYRVEQFNFTPNYLSKMLRSLTGLNAQQHIHQN